MNIKLDASAVLALALGCFASLANAIEVQAPGVYTPEYTADWFSVETQDLDIQGENWVSTDGAVVKDGHIDLDTDISSPLTYKPAPATVTNITRIVTTLTVTQSSELPKPAELDGAKTALCVCTNASGDVKWFAFVDNDFVDNDWLELTNAVPNAEYEVILDSDSINSKIRYLAKKSGDPNYTDLTGGWVSNSASSSHIEKVSFAGSTTLGDFAGIDVAQGYAYGGVVYKSLGEAAAVASAAAAGADNIELPVSGDSVASAKISLDWIQDNVPGAKGGNVDWSAVQANLNGKGNNDIARWQSYVLGLDPANALSKPIVQPVQDAAPGKVSFSLGNVALANNSGVGVQYRVGEYSSPQSETPIEGKAGTFVDAGTTATVDLPESGVKYYKLEVKLSN